MTTNLIPTIDRIGQLEVEIAKLQAEQDALKAVMREVGSGRYLGDRYQVTVTEASTRESYDKAAKAKIDELVKTHLSVQYLTAHTVTTTVKPSVRVTARMDVAAAAYAAANFNRAVITP